MPQSPTPTVALFAAALGLAGLLSMSLASAQVPPLREPVHRDAVAALTAGTLLVAARHLPDSNFSKTVILLGDVTRGGAVGVVLNRRSTVPLARVFPQLVPNLATASLAFLGGPVETTRTMALIRAAQGPAGTRHVVDGVHLATAREAVEAAITAGTTATHLRIYLGYAGWSPGQLEAETGQGAWHVLPGDADVVFDPDPASAWQRQIARTDVMQARQVELSPRPRS